MPAFEDVVALNGVSFSVGRGEIVGLLGPNGAGKSTTVKILCGVLHPTSGDVRVLGRNPHRQRVENAQEIGVLFGHRSHLFHELTAADSFRFLRAVYQIDDADYRRNVTRLTSLLELDTLQHQVVRTLSLGQRMRCEVAATFLHEPKVVYLDEPTIGLDVNAKRTIRALIRALVDELGTTVILTTHDLADIEELCRRVILIDHGRVVYDGELRRLRERYAHSKTVQAEVASHARERVTAGILAAAPQAQVAPLGALLRVTGLADEPSVMSVARAMLGDADVTDLTITEPRVEEIIGNVFREGVPLMAAVARPTPAGGAD